jgi:hypothetical protein
MKKKFQNSIQIFLKNDSIKEKKSSLSQRTEGSCGRARVNKELVVLLEGLELMRVTCDEHVNVQLTLQHAQALLVAPRNNLMAVRQSNSELPHCHDLLLGKLKIL